MLLDLILAPHVRIGDRKIKEIGSIFVGELPVQYPLYLVAGIGVHGGLTRN